MMRVTETEALIICNAHGKLQMMRVTETEALTLNGCKHNVTKKVFVKPGFG